jgi:hypothetical protein
MTEDETEKLGLIYRILLRFPKLSLENFPYVLQGLFWVIILPTFLLGEFFLNFYILLALPFPLNLVVAVGVDLLFIVAMLRVMLERALNAFKMLFYPSHMDKDVTQLVQEYISLIRKKRK